MHEDEISNTVDPLTLKKYIFSLAYVGSNLKVFILFYN